MIVYSMNRCHYEYEIEERLLAEAIRVGITNIENLATGISVILLGIPCRVELIFDEWEGDAECGPCASSFISIRYNYKKAKHLLRR